MKIKYFQHDPQNFGDALNAYIWKHILPKGFLDDDGSNDIFLGIGTLINHRLDSNNVYWILGSGVGYGKIPAADIQLKIFALRGPRSAQALKASKDLAITDAAAFLATIRSEHEPTRKGIAYIPHFTEEIHNGNAWRQCCSLAGIKYINPCDPVEVVINNIRSSTLVLTEAMHGAIVSDVYRVPWIAISSKNDIDEFKWTDWCNSLNLDYRPVRIHRISSIIGFSSMMRSLITALIPIQLFIIARRGSPQLSSQYVLQNRLTRLFEARDSMVSEWIRAKGGPQYD